MKKPSPFITNLGDRLRFARAHRLAAEVVVRAMVGDELMIVWLAKNPFCELCERSVWGSDLTSAADVATAREMADALTLGAPRPTGLGWAGFVESQWGMVEDVAEVLLRSGVLTTWSLVATIAGAV